MGHFLGINGRGYGEGEPRDGISRLIGKGNWQLRKRQRLPQDGHGTFRSVLKKASEYGILYNKMGYFRRLRRELADRLQGDYSMDLEALMREYGNDVLRTAYLYMRDVHAAEDVFQEVFLKVSQKLDTFRGDSSVKTWLIRITINTCKDHLKSAWNQRVVPLEEEAERTLGADSDFEEIERRETSRCVKEAVDGLPEQYRDVVRCVYFHDMSVAEAAETLGLAEGTVKSRLARGRERLKKMLEGRV